MSEQSFFSNATIAETKRTPTDAGLTSAFVAISITVFVVKLNSKLILCERWRRQPSSGLQSGVCFRFRQDDGQHEGGWHRSQKGRDGPNFTFPS
jgi:hypothetical protein